MLVCCESKLLLVGWWLVLVSSERKILLVGWRSSQQKRVKTAVNVGMVYSDGLGYAAVNV